MQRGRPPGSGNKRKLLNGVTGGAVEKKVSPPPLPKSPDGTPSCEWIIIIIALPCCVHRLVRAKNSKGRMK